MSGTTLPPPTPEQVAALQGAQVVLDPASKASEGARGVYDNLHDNTEHRNAGYIEMELDPHDPSGELTDPDPAPPAADAEAQSQAAKRSSHTNRSAEHANRSTDRT